jgi:hypothetical protein
MNDIKIGITHREFGQGVEVSKSFMEHNKDARKLVEDDLMRLFKLGKKKYFPNWYGEPRITQGPDVTHVVPRMKDGSEVTEELYEEYSSVSELSFFVRHPECEPYSYDVHVFGWYALVPVEYVVGE